MNYYEQPSGYPFTRAEFNGANKRVLSLVQVNEDAEEFYVMIDVYSEEGYPIRTEKSIKVEDYNLALGVFHNELNNTFGVEFHQSMLRH